MLISSKYPGTCLACGKPIAVGAQVSWIKGRKGAEHAACSEEGKGAVVAQAESRATDAEVDVPAPDGLAYLPYQRGGIAYALKRTGALIGDEPGLGKTIQAIGVINGDETIKRVLVICPKSLTLNWVREMRRWLVRPLTVSNTVGGSDVVVVSYDNAKKYQDQLTARAASDAIPAVPATAAAPAVAAVPAKDAIQDWDLVVVDEAHLIKNSKAQRTKTVHAIAKSAKRRLALTGTPIANRPIELFSILSLVDPANWDAGGKGFMPFARRYAGAYRGKFGWDFKGATNLPELQDRLRATCMVRRLKADVLTELPAKRRQVVEVDANGASAAVKRERDAWERNEATVTRLRADAELARASDDPNAYQAAVGRLSDQVKVAFAEMSALRHETAIAKAPKVVEHVRDALEDGDNKVVIFAWHHDVIDTIVKGLGGHVEDSGGFDFRKVDGDQSEPISSANDGLPMHMRHEEACGDAVAPGGDVEGVHVLSTDETRSVKDEDVPAVVGGEESREAGRHTIHLGVDGHRGAEGVPSAGDTAGVRRGQGVRNESVAGSDRSVKGVQQGEHVGHQLEGQRNKAQRNARGIGAVDSESARASFGAVKIDGRDDIATRQAAVDRFQTDPTCRVFVGSITAAGVGITLTAAAHVVFAELDWVPGNVTQAEDRCHRIGQKASVLIQHLVLDGSLDARMAHVLVDKQKIADAGLDLVAALEPAVPGEKPATAGSRAELDKVAATLKPETVEAVHQALRRLAGMCDGAATEDGAGFSKIDVQIGHSLAQSPRLSPRQAALGLRLCRKYRRQIGDVIGADEVPVRVSTHVEREDAMIRRLDHGERE